MRKNDWILIAAVLILAMAGLGIHFFQPQQDTGMVVVSINGEEYGSWPLSEDCTVEIEGTNRLVIEDGQADMAWADCPDQICVHQKAIMREGESIICLPNKVVVSIVGGMEREVDAVTKRPGTKTYTVSGEVRPPRRSMHCGMPFGYTTTNGSAHLVHFMYICGRQYGIRMDYDIREVFI